MSELGILWDKVYCKRCDEEVKVMVSRKERMYNGDSAYPRNRHLIYTCVCCNKTLKRYDLTKEAQKEWDDNAEYCSQNFRNYIILRDQLRVELNE